jgi:hypothetical protein
MKNIKYDYCLNFFKDHDNTDRPYLNKINLGKDGYLYASDSRVVVRLNPKYCVKKYNEMEDYPDILILNKKVVESKKFNIDTLFHVLMKNEIFFKPSNIICPECDGAGKDICEYCGGTCECDNCGGFSEVCSDYFEIQSDFECILFNKKYKLNYINRILTVSIILGCKEIEIRNSYKDYFSLFLVDKLQIFLMNKNENNKS